MKQNKDGLTHEGWHSRNDKYDNLIACICGSFDPFLSTTGVDWFVLGFLIWGWFWTSGLGMRVGRTGDRSFFCFWLGMAEVGAWESRSMKPKGVQDLLFSHSQETRYYAYHTIAIHKYVVHTYCLPTKFLSLCARCECKYVDASVTDDIWYHSSRW